MNLSPPIPNKEAKSMLGENKAQMSCLGVHNTGNEAEETHQKIHTPINSLVTIQKMKFKRDPETLYSCSLVNWTAGGAPNDLQFNLNYVILSVFGESEQRGKESTEKGLQSGRKLALFA